MPSLTPDRMVDVRRIYAEPAALDLPRGKEIVQRFPEAEVVEVRACERRDARQPCTSIRRP